MNKSLETATTALQRIPGWNPALATVQKALTGGPSNQSWLVDYQGDKFVVRVDTPLTNTLHLNRQAEAIASDVAAAAGLTPSIVYASVQHGIQVRPFVSGRTWTTADLNDEQQLQRLANVLRKLHTLTPALAPFDLQGVFHRYADQLGTAEASRCAQEAFELLMSVADRPLVLCHNDLVAENIIDSEPLNIIDWEYAAIGNPLFDLAVVVQHHHLPPKRTSQFLKFYFGEADRRTQKDVQTFCQVYDRLLVLWSALLRRHSQTPA